MMARFSLLQFNTLADALSDSFPLVDGNVLKWEHRRTLLVEQILKAAPDVVCMEEVDHFDDWFAPRLAVHGYTGVFFPKAPGRDGCAMFVKGDRVRFGSAQVQRVCLRDHIDIRAVPNADGRQGAIVAELELVASGRRVVVAVTHLKAKSEFDDVRFHQTKALLSLLAAHRANGLPIVLAGDFNTEPASTAIALVTKEGFRSAYDLSSLKYTTWKIRPPSEACRVIDYIFYSPESLQLVAVTPMPTPNEIPHPRLPSARFASDHLPLQATFHLN